MIDPFLLANNSSSSSRSSNNNHFQQQPQQPTSWFDDYDWVIRLNPDVLIRNDTWLISTMMNDSIDAIFHDCYNRKLYPSNHDDKNDVVENENDDNGDHPTLSSSIPQFHTDFTAFRPRAINRDLVCSALTRNVTFNSTGSNEITSIAFPITVAEHHYTGAVWNIYQSQRFVYLEGGNTTIPGHCRLEGVHSPVLHVHELVNDCPYYYNAKRPGVY
jgi:hypothetical protein